MMTYEATFHGRRRLPSIDDPPGLIDFKVKVEARTIDMARSWVHEQFDEVTDLYVWSELHPEPPRPPRAARLAYHEAWQANEGSTPVDRAKLIAALSEMRDEAASAQDSFSTPPSEARITYHEGRRDQLDALLKRLRQSDWPEA